MNEYVFDDNNMKLFDTESLESLDLISSSKGNQRKWYDHSSRVFVKEQFVYQGVHWKDYLVECIASEIGAQLKLNAVTILEQKQCRIYDRGNYSYGCYSKDFREKADDMYVSFDRIMKLENKEWLLNWFPQIAFDFVTVTIKNVTGLDYREYLVAMCLLDYLIGNEDRHLNNFGVMKNQTGFKLAPLFDTGLGLFEHDRRYEGKTLDKALLLMQGKPFHQDLEVILNCIARDAALKCMLVDMLPAKFTIHSNLIPSSLAQEYLHHSVATVGKITNKDIRLELI